MFGWQKTLKMSSDNMVYLPVHLRQFKGGSVWVFVALLCICCVVVWSVIYFQSNTRVLQVSYLNVGQGDAVLITTPQGNQVLIDGGKGQAVLRELGGSMSFFDRTIDVVVATHPDKDHIGGLPAVFARYNISHVIESGVLDDGEDAQALETQLSKEEGLMRHVAKKGMRVALDEGVYLEILFPDRDVFFVDPNVGSIIARLVYNEVSFMFTGDAPQGIEEYLVSQEGEVLQSTVLKVGHHGSKTSSSALFLERVQPLFGVLSYGCDNTYGHPHQEVLDRLEERSIQILDTCTQGSVTFETDGATVTVL
jgi:competence protein ComEC